MRVGLQRPFDRQPLLSRGGKNGFHRTHVDRSIAMVEIQHGIDDRGAVRHGIGDQIADGVGGLVEERRDGGKGCLRHGGTPEVDRC